MKQLLLLLALMMSATSATAELKLGKPFGNGMVLQRNKPVPVWGIADAKAAVSVTFGDQTIKTEADEKGQWQLELSALKANATPQTLKVVAGSTQLEVTDILVGEVWLASGQSNMRWKVNQSANGKQFIGKTDKVNSQIRLLDYYLPTNLYPKHRKFPLKKLESLTPDNYFLCDGWKPATDKKALSNFSAVAYYFARELQEKLNVPVGVIMNAVGGATNEAYISYEALNSVPEYKPLVDSWLTDPNYSNWCQGRAKYNLSEWLEAKKPGTPAHAFKPGWLFESGMRKLAPFALQGFIWYQGESNAPNPGDKETAYKGGYSAESSEAKLKLMIKDWRAQWQDENLPFYFVQLASLGNRPWARFRELQTRVWQETPNTGMAVTHDLGHSWNVHPNAKQPVGQRLAAVAMNKVYGAADQPASGPVFQSYKVDGNKIVLTFNGVDQVATVDGKAVKGFVIREKNGAFVPATATIVGDKIEVVGKGIKQPEAVRYAWVNSPMGNANLVGAKGKLYVPSFRTDSDPIGHVVKEEVVRIACVGDSITFGSTIKNRAKDSYPAQMQALLGKKYKVGNFGNPGRGIIKKSMRGKGKRAFIFMKEHQQALKFMPDIVIINLGINDVMDINKYEADFVPDYIELINAYKSLPSKPAVYIWGQLAPLFKGQKFFGDPRTPKLNVKIAEVIKKTGVGSIDMRTPFLGKGELFKDHIHPNGAGATIIMKETVKRLKEDGAIK